MSRWFVYEYSGHHKHPINLVFIAGKAVEYRKMIIKRDNVLFFSRGQSVWLQFEVMLENTKSDRLFSKKRYALEIDFCVPALWNLGNKVSSFYSRGAPMFMFFYVCI